MQPLRDLAIAALAALFVLAPACGAGPEGLVASATGHAVPPLASPAQDAPAVAASVAAARLERRYALTTEDGLSPAGETVRAWLVEAPLHGVDVDLDAVIAAWTDLRAPDTRDAAEEALLDGLVLLATALPARPSDRAVLIDEDGAYVSPDVLWRDAAPVSPTDADRATALAAARDEPELSAWLAARAPAHPRYRALVDAARRYRALCEAGGWAPAPEVTGPRAEAWKDADAVRRVQARLAVEGFHPGEPSGDYDEATRAAVARYRDARQLRAGSVYDADVAAAMNVPCRERLATLLLNVRRWRHTAQTDERTYVRVDLPGAMVRYYRDGELAREHRAVVGSGRGYYSKVRGRYVRDNATPVMRDLIVNVVINPEWKAPARLVRTEILPGIEKDPDYLEKKQMRVVAAASGQQMYVQSHGPHNALGQAKIAFPNGESVYLHDTPHKGFFRHPVRAFSHGCVRVQGAIDLAYQLIDDDFARRGQGYNRYVLDQLVKKNEKTYWFSLEQPVPIFLEYYTADVGDDGVALFFEDIYGYDVDARDVVLASVGLHPAD